MAESEPWVINASPLILLARIGQLTWLEQLTKILWVPERVIREIAEGSSFDPSATTALVWAARFRLSDIAIPERMQGWDIDPGESQVIAHGLRLNCYTVMDDAAARRCAKALGLSVIGTMGVVLRAKEMGLMTEAKPWLIKMCEAGMYADATLIQSALDVVGESDK